jgi:hypothetical protein
MRSSALTDSSCPVFGALVLGVTRARGSGSFLRRPSGSAWPQKLRAPEAYAVQMLVLVTPVR